jgi:hypothetical protein
MDDVGTGEYQENGGEKFPTKRGKILCPPQVRLGRDWRLANLNEETGQKQDCQSFLDTMYQNGEKNIPNDRKITEWS